MTLGRLIAVALVCVALLGGVTASVAAWVVGRLEDLQAAEERTETLADALADLSEVRAPLDSLHHATGLTTFGARGPVTTSTLPGVAIRVRRKRPMELTRLRGHLVVAA